MKQITPIWHTLNEMMRLSNLLKDFKLFYIMPITLHYDNQSTMYVASVSIHEKIKRIQFDCQFYGCY